MRLEGSFVGIITPFNTDGSVDFGAFRTLIDFQARHGTAALLILGSTGEVSLLTDAERRAIVERTAAMRPAGIKLFYGCTGNSTDGTIALLRHSQAAGADGAILAAPPYIAASEEDIEAYLLDCADAVDLPLGIYNNPPRVKTDLTTPVLLRVLAHPNYVVMKESTARVGQIAQLLAAKPDVAVMCADSPALGLVFPTMSLGGQGLANMTGNLDPAGMAMLARPWDGDPAQPARYREAWFRLMPLMEVTYGAPNPVAVKSLMGAMGLPAGDLRRPLRGLPPAKVAQGMAVIRRLGLMEQYGLRLAA